MDADRCVIAISNVRPVPIQSLPKFSSSFTNVDGVATRTGNQVDEGTGLASEMAMDWSQFRLQLKALANMHEWQASRFLNNEWFEMLILSSTSIILRNGRKFFSLFLALTVKTSTSSQLQVKSCAPVAGRDAKSTTFGLILTSAFFFFFGFQRKATRVGDKKHRKKSTWPNDLRSRAVFVCQLKPGTRRRTRRFLCRPVVTMTTYTKCM